MATKKIEDSFVMGNIKIPYHIELPLQKHVIKLVLYMPFEEVTAQEYLKAKLEAYNKGLLSQEEFTFEVKRVQNNARYIPEALPDPLVVGQMKIQGRLWNVPSPSIAWELYQAVKKYNPFDRSREGNTNQLVFPNGEKTSIGSFCQLVLGISQTRQSPNGGLSGGYSPHVAFEGLIPHGYSASIVSTSPQYKKVLSMLAEAKVKAEVKPVKKPANKKPAKK